MTPKERTAMQQALGALEHLQNWPMSKEAITALREALAEQAEQRSDSERMEPVAEVREDLGETIEQLWVYEPIPVGTKLYANPVLPATNDIVGECEVYAGENGDANFEGFRLTLPKHFPSGHYRLYTAPVRTKDLTDDEIDEIGKSYFDEWSFGFARAIIAADRRKNK